MTFSSRRSFLQNTGFAFAAIVTGSSFITKKRLPLLSFSTLGCPDWTIEQIIDFAALNNYQAIEVRGIQHELDLTKCAAFSTVENRITTMSRMKDKGLKFIDLGSSATLHFKDPKERLKNIEEGKRFIDLAAQLECNFIRVFPNNFPKEQEKQETMDLISKGLLELGDYAKGSNVRVLLESHGDLVKIEDLERIMIAAKHAHTGMIWDICNMWTETKESPLLAYKKLKKYIHHTHIKDARLTDGKIQYVFLGKGEVPIFEAIDVLSKNGYKGFYSFEWEKLWHPELEEPTLALADYTIAMKQHFEKH